MALINCPHCGQPISDSAVQCPHCQKQIVTASQINRTKKFSLTAMWLCILGIVFYLISYLYDEFVFIPNVTSLSQEEWRIWYTDHLAVMNLMSLIGKISSLCVCSAWLVWFVREKGHRNAILQTGVVICIIGIGVRMLKIIPNITWYNIFNFDENSINTFYITCGIVTCLLNFALGIVATSLKSNNITKKLTTIAGVALIISSLYYLALLYVSDIAKLLQYTTMSPLLRILDLFLWVCAIVTFIVLFYNTYKQAKIM
jgi:hypothetical protein